MGVERYATDNMEPNSDEAEIVQKVNESACFNLFTVSHSVLVAFNHHCIRPRGPTTDMDNVNEAIISRCPKGP